MSSTTTTTTTTTTTSTSVAPQVTNLQNAESTFTSYANAYQSYLSSPQVDSDKTSFNTAKNSFSTNINNLYALNHKYATIKNYREGTTTETMVDSCFNAIQTSFQTNRQLSEHLDNQIMDLQTTPQLSDSKMYLDTTIFTGICWTMIASGLLYYILIEM
jgi:hypothetical protein